MSTLVDRTRERRARLDTARERRQFELLLRDSVRQILASATMSKDADPMQAAIWGTALALTAPFLVAVRKVIDYPFLLRAPVEYVERVVLADRLFFLIYGMLATALLVALLWDSLSPTRHDHEIVGVLPVHPRTLAGARFIAAVGVGLGFALAITLPAALIYSAASAVHPLVGSFPRVLFGHLVAALSASAFVFLSMLAIRSLSLVAVGDAISARLAVAIQILTFVLLIQVFFFLPGLLPELLKDVLAGGTTYARLPPMWFAGLFLWLADGRTVAAGLVASATLSVAIAALLATAVSILPASVARRRDLERRADVSTGPVLPFIRAVTGWLVRASEVRALYLFSVASLARSRRHAVHLGTYAGLAVAAALVGVATTSIKGTLSVTAPHPALLALPLVFSFFAVLGLRSACAIPVDLDANWPLRLRQPSLHASLAATRLFLLTLGVLPPVAMFALASAWLWDARVAGWIAVWDLSAGVLLIELALASWTKVPFATQHEPAVDTVRTKWPWLLLALYFYGFQLAIVQVWCLPSPHAPAVLEGVAVTCVAVATLRTRRRLRHRAVTFEAPEEGFETLRLSPALD
jgi:hypothetical protein